MEEIFGVRYPGLRLAAYPGLLSFCPAGASQHGLRRRRIVLNVGSGLRPTSTPRVGRLTGEPLMAVMVVGGGCFVENGWDGKAVSCELASRGNGTRGAVC